MKILLINPKDSGYYYRLGAFFPPLGLAYISSSLKNAGYETRLIDMNVENFDYKKESYEEYDVIGISTDTVRFPLAAKIGKDARKKGTIVIMGGPHATFNAHSILKEGLADYIILGEGEIAFVELVKAISVGEMYPEIPGIAYLKENVVKIFPVKFVKNLDVLPFPDREGLPLHKYRTKFAGNYAMSIITSRGCPFDCNFCSVTQFMGKMWRQRSVESTVEELKILVEKFGYKSVVFFDDNFTLNPGRVIRLSDEIIKNDLKIKWWAFSRADELLRNEDMVEAMAKSGCKMLFIGFESANEEVLEEFNKKLHSNIAFEVSSLLRKYKIDIFASFILGALNETTESIKRTVKFAKKLGASIVQFSILTPYPGTKLFEQLKTRLLTKNYEKFDGTHLVFKHPHFSPEKLRREFLKAYYAVYTTPRLIFKRGFPFLWKLLANSR
ncbi:B12-binding domain-containing radical SAM protein [Thermosipho ferrireducens]|uniref:B12-binding domain-containing radical SAM protein n=1 Tax=Thermosipho ferrireducens TaxID=2571116 RepID=A0ABX7S5Q2_9BACT|nr:radical SAM protein [Thermosipho ferrireducens]QTA37884.1 B12-binding domain-containing radical SAM protein [Thermosipho ferrireducens]